MSESSCHNLARSLGAYIDGELEPTTLLAFDAHIEACSCCADRVRFARMTRASVRAVCKSAQAPQSLKLRAAKTLEQARARSAAPSDVMSHSKMLSWRVAGPTAAAAAIALVWAAVAKHPLPLTGDPAAHGSSLASAVSVDTLLDELVDQHARPLPPEATSPKDIEHFDQFVGVPVHTLSFQNYQGQLLGARMVPVLQQRAAMLQYVLTNGRRVSVYIYNPRSLRIASSSTLRPRVVQDAAPPVYVGYIRGYSVAVTDKRGVGYAVTSDLDEQESSQLVAAAVGTNP